VAKSVVHKERTPAGSSETVTNAGKDGREEQRACSFFACINSLVIMADMPTSAARTLIDVKEVGMLLFSHLRCRFQVLELFPGHLLARKGKFATPRAIRSAVAPQRPPLRQTLFYTPSPHSGMRPIVHGSFSPLGGFPRTSSRSCGELCHFKANRCGASCTK
jgi:hypothetical protein